MKRYLALCLILAISINFSSHTKQSTPPQQPSIAPLQFSSIEELSVFASNAKKDIKSKMTDGFAQK